MAEVTQIDIEVEYITHSKDQAVYLTLSSNKRLRAGLNEPIKMRSDDGKHWHQTIELPSRKVDEIDYQFTVRTRQNLIDEEKGHGQFAHHLLFQNTPHISVKALWHSDMGKNYLYSSAYSDVVYPFVKDQKVSQTINSSDLVVAFTDYVPPAGHQIYLCGSNQATGNWQPLKGIPGLKVHNASWAFPLNRTDIPAEGLNYKFVLISPESSTPLWESGHDRYLPPQHPDSGKVIIDTHTPLLPHDDLKIAGVVVPLFSLRSEEGWGIGDFGDLQRLIDWAADSGLSIIQLLPVNDTTREGNWHDSYPYNPISAFALHPLYLDFNSLPPLKSKTKLKLYLQRRAAVNSQPLLDYDEVFDLKESYLHDYFLENKQDILRSTKYKIFKRDNADWLMPYSFFRYLLKINGTANFRRWPQFREYDQVALQRWAIASNILDDIEFYSVVQFLLDKQFAQIHEYATQRGVILKGDIPIGVARDSATAWLQPQYLNFDSQAGAPPDQFSANGQNWGFPTYNWPAILDDDGIWWHRRLNHMAQYFDAYRIDHVLGFFRIWEIPLQHIYGTLGHFNPGLPLTRSGLLLMGFTADPETYTRPRFTEGEMQRHFGELLPVAKEYFFQFGQDGKWTITDKYVNSQRTIDKALREMGFSGQQRELFLSAYNNILFIAHPGTTQMYHINIWGKNTRAYRHLSDTDKQAYDRIYQYFFYERHDRHWTDEAYQRLPKLTCATPMLACAEDLGMIPTCVHPVLKDLNILTLEIQTMPKRGNGRFSDLHDNPLYSVDTISTHDMAPLRLWWKQNPEAAADYWHNILGNTTPPPALLSPDDCKAVISRHLQSNSLLTIISLQDLLGMSQTMRSDQLEQEQINHPEIPRHYWRWRMQPTLEQLAADKDFSRQIRKMVKDSNRTVSK